MVGLRKFTGTIGKKFATGSGTFTPTNGNEYVRISGLSFKPSKVIIVCYAYTGMPFYGYTILSLDTNDFFSQGMWSTTYNWNAGASTVDHLGNNGLIYPDGFSARIYTGSYATQHQYKWYAFE